MDSFYIVRKLDIFLKSVEICIFLDIAQELIHCDE